jgi:hypothetical protein
MKCLPGAPVLADPQKNPWPDSQPNLKDGIMMKPISTLVLAFVLACSALVAAEPALPPIPAVLEPLKAKVTNGWYSYKGGLYLNFRAEQPLTEEQWNAIAGLGAKGIGTGGKSVDDEFVARLAKMHLEALSFDGAESLTDGCFQHLATMKSLQRLSMGHMQQKDFTGKGLALLKDLPALESLTLAGSRVGSDAMEAIGQLTQLKELANWHTTHSDPRNPYLLNLKNLKSLKLGRSSARGKDGKEHSCLTDETMTTFAQMKSLESLTLSQARLTLPALLKLKALPNLKILKFESMEVAVEDLAKLRAELPGVTINLQPMTDRDREIWNTVLKNE